MHEKIKLLLLTSFIVAGFILGISFSQQARLLFTLIRPLLFLLVFCVGTFIDVNEIKACLMKKKHILFTALVARLCLISFTAFLIARIFNLDKQLYTGFIYLGIVPSAMTAAIISKINGGNVSLNVVMTFIMMLLSPLTVPLLSYMYLHHVITLNPIHMFNRMLFNVLLPLLLGMVCKKMVIKRRKMMALTVDSIAVLSIVLIVMGVAAHNHQRLYHISALHVVYALSIYFVVTYTLAVAVFNIKFFNLDQADKISLRNELTLSDCALSAMLSSLTNSLATVPSAIAAFWQIMCIVTLNIINKMFEKNKQVKVSKYGYRSF